VRALDVRVAGGLHVLVLTDRGMDLGPAWHLGQPLAWISPTGPVHPSFGTVDTWLRAFHGGLLVTAGLQNVGPRCDEDGQAHGLHGRASGTPARNVRWEVREDGDGPVVEVSGTVREADVFGADLVLTRTLSFSVGKPAVELRDEVENRGFADTPLMILYHVNLGWPVVDDHARFIAPDRSVRAFDELAAPHVARHEVVGPPTPGAQPEVYEHLLHGDGDVATVGVVNERFAPTGGLGVSIAYRPAQLPRLWHWRMRGQGMYLTGVEPANCGIRGRDAELAEGAVDVLAPGERRRFDLTLTAHAGHAAAQFASTAGVATVAGPDRQEL
jgi:hypothetical protein